MPRSPDSNPADEALGDRALDHIRVLASDEFAGRQPGHSGEEPTVSYLREQCIRMGLQGAGLDGSFYQEVPVVGNTIESAITVDFGDDDPIRLEVVTDYVARSRHLEVSLEAPLVFAGFGIQAPEFGWDDFRGIDVTGKVVVVLSGDPVRPDPEDPSRPDPDFFRGSGMSYYGRWDHKFEMAASRGAAGCLIIHNDARAGYPFSVIQESWKGEHLGAELSDDRAQLEGWLSEDVAAELLRRRGHDLTQLTERAFDPTSSAIPLEVTIRATITNTRRRFHSRNVVARVAGVDPLLADECVVFTAHWDHLGQRVEGDQVTIYRGALDNASGVAALLEIAREYAEKPARRSIVFVFTTLEESGLIGAAHYAANPVVPLEKTLAVINLDVMNLWGRTSDVLSVGLGHSTLDELLADVAASQGRRVVPDPEPEKGYFFRSDHLEFMLRGVPALFLHPGSDVVDRPLFGESKQRSYVVDHYHKPSDAVDDEWNTLGMVDDIRLLTIVGRAVADATTFPTWYESSEFSRARTQMR